MAAVLACGPGAVLSHGSAAALWGIGPLLPGVEVTIPIASPRRREGVHIHRRPNLLPAHTTVCKAIPVTNPVRTSIDLACRLDSTGLERMINETAFALSGEGEAAVPAYATGGQRLSR